jgi:hypothetical protein
MLQTGSTNAPIGDEEILMDGLQITTELAVSDETVLMERVTFDDVWDARKPI